MIKCKSARTVFMVIAMLMPVADFAAQQPLSCEVESLLNATTAMRRDQGTSKKDTAVGINADGELTKSEISEILNRVYLTQKNKTPQQIRDSVYAACKKRIR